MKQTSHAAKTELPKPILPKWIMAGSVTNTLEAAGFASGSALSLLHVLLNDPETGVPVDLLRNRLALRAAINCLKIEGRVQTEADIRDAYYLTAPGDVKGPAGDMFAFWRTGSSLRLGTTNWRTQILDMLPEEMRDDVSVILEKSLLTAGSPIAIAIAVLKDVLKSFPRQETAALFCADVILSHGLGWGKSLPLFGLYLNRKTLRAATDGEDIRMDCHVAVSRAAQEAVRLAHDLARRCARLRAIEPKLRAKGSVEALNLFLSENAVYAPTMLSPMIRGSNVPMTDRSARRFCDRLVELGAVRELTGRKTFRLYGVA